MNMFEKYDALTNVVRDLDPELCQLPLWTGGKRPFTVRWSRRPWLNRSAFLFIAIDVPYWLL